MATMAQKEQKIKKIIFYRKFFISEAGGTISMNFSKDCKNFLEFMSCFSDLPRNDEGSLICSVNRLKSIKLVLEGFTNLIATNEEKKKLFLRQTFSLDGSTEEFFDKLFEHFNGHSHSYLTLCEQIISKMQKFEAKEVVLDENFSDYQNKSLLNNFLSDKLDGESEIIVDNSKEKSVVLPILFENIMKGDKVLLDKIKILNKNSVLFSINDLMDYYFHQLNIVSAPEYFNSHFKNNLLSLIKDLRDYDKFTILKQAQKILDNKKNLPNKISFRPEIKKFLTNFYEIGSIPKILFNKMSDIIKTRLKVSFWTVLSFFLICYLYCMPFVYNHLVIFVALALPMRLKVFWPEIDFVIYSFAIKGIFNKVYDLFYNQSGDFRIFLNHTSKEFKNLIHKTEDELLSRVERKRAKGNLKFVTLFFYKIKKYLCFIKNLTINFFAALKHLILKPSASYVIIKSYINYFFDKVKYYFANREQEYKNWEQYLEGVRDQLLASKNYAINIVINLIDKVYFYTKKSAIDGVNSLVDSLSNLISFAQSNPVLTFKPLINLAAEVTGLVYIINFLMTFIVTSVQVTTGVSLNPLLYYAPNHAYYAKGAFEILDYFKPYFLLSFLIEIVDDVCFKKGHDDFTVAELIENYTPLYCQNVKEKLTDFYNHPSEKIWSLVGRSSDKNSADKTPTR